MVTEKNFDLQVLKGKKILVVDDLLDNRMLECLYLKRVGAHVEQACNGVEAVAKALLQNPDAILMDLHMPELDGLGAISRLRKEGYIKPIIAITANGQQSVRQTAFELGVDEYISKPLMNSEWLKCLARLCRDSEEDNESNSEKKSEAAGVH